MRVVISGLLVALVSLVGAALTPASAGAALGVATEKAQVAPATVQPARWRWRRHRWYRPYYYGYYHRPYRRRYHYYRPYRSYGWGPRFHFRFGHRRHRRWW